MIVIRRGIKRADKSHAVLCEWLGITLGNEIITIIRIRITSAANSGGTFPAYATLGVKKSSVAIYVERHFSQVVSFPQILFRKHFILQIAAIAIDSHLGKIGKARLPDKTFRQLVYPRGRHSDFRPVTLRQDRMLCVSIVPIH